jgi:hypothetical protein
MTDVKNDGSEGQKKEEGGQIDEALKSLKLKDSEIEALKGNENLLNVLLHNLETKRSANKEAKDYREKLEALQKEREEEEKQKLSKKGEFEKLYQEASEKLSQKDQRIKDALIKGELARLAGQNGLAKPEYLKLLDTSKIQVDVETLNVEGAEDLFNEFKSANPELFKQAVPGTDNGQPNIKAGAKNELEELKRLEIAAKNSGMPKDLARFKSMKSELIKKGLIK